MTDSKYHAERRRIMQFINAAAIRLQAAAASKATDRVQRAAEDMAQAVDELLDLVGGNALSYDCPDCGQYIVDAIDILAEGEGE